MNASLIIVSGGQFGADRAALDWAIEHGVPHGGWCPKGRKAEDGPTLTMNRRFWTAVFAIGVCLPLVAAQTDYAQHIAPLIDPAKLATLGLRQANPRVQRAVYWLATARQAGQKPDRVLDVALTSAGMKKEAAELTKAALLRNLDIADKLGCLDAEGLAKMKRGKAPTVKRGPYKGDQLTVDHIIPRAVCPELDNVIANLELMPLRMNEGKSARVGARQVDLARKLHAAGLLSADGLRAVQTHR